MMKNILFSLLLLLAVGVNSAIFAKQPDPQTAQEVIAQTAKRMQSALLANRDKLMQDSSGIYDLVAEILLPHFDFETVSRLVLGKHWRDASPQQKQQFINEFRTLMVRTYAKAVLEYADADIRYLPIRPSKNADQVTVRSEIYPSSGPAFPIDYDMCHDGQMWKVCNITIDKSINFVINYRKQLSSQIRSVGLEQVIVQLADRNNQY